MKAQAVPQRGNLYVTLVRIVHLLPLPQVVYALQATRYGREAA